MSTRRTLIGLSAAGILGLPAPAGRLFLARSLLCAGVAGSGQRYRSPTGGRRALGTRPRGYSHQHQSVQPHQPGATRFLHGASGARGAGGLARCSSGGMPEGTCAGVRRCRVPSPNSTCAGPASRSQASARATQSSSPPSGWRDRGRKLICWPRWWSAANTASAFVALTRRPTATSAVRVDQLTLPQAAMLAAFVGGEGPDPVVRRGDDGEHAAPDSRRHARQQRD